MTLTSGMAAGAAAVLVGAAVSLVLPGSAGREPRRPVRPQVGGRGRPFAGFAPPSRLTWAIALPAALVVLVAPAVLAVAVLAAVGGLLVASRRRAVAAARTAQEVTSAVAELATALAADLTAGHPPVAALVALADEQRAPPHTRARAELASALNVVAAGAALGADVPSAMRQQARVPGAGGLRSVAAGWEVAERTGASLAPVLEQVAAGLRDELAADRAVGAALAGSRSTARLLAGLPAVGLAMGAGLGVSPLSFLLGTGVGRVCLLTGLALEVAGLVWTDRLASLALRPAVG